MENRIGAEKKKNKINWVGSRGYLIDFQLKTLILFFTTRPKWSSTIGNWVINNKHDICQLKKEKWVYMWHM